MPINILTMREIPGQFKEFSEGFGNPDRRGLLLRFVERDRLLYSPLQGSIAVSLISVPSRSTTFQSAEDVWAAHPVEASGASVSVTVPPRDAAVIALRSNR